VNALSILHIGRNSGTSRQRVFALRRLGHSVFSIDPKTILPDWRLSGVWAWKTGGLFLENYIRRGVLGRIPQTTFDLAFVDSGELIGPSLVCELKKRFGTVINYNNDDPYGSRDGRRWRLYLAAAPIYDLIIVVRDLNVTEAHKAGASNVLRVLMSADEIEHSPRPLQPQDYSRWASDVVFVGTWMRERGPFMTRLIELGVPLSIYGDSWQKAPEWRILRSVWRGPALYGDEYARVIQCAKVCLGLLSKGNRDLSTQRSFEIPHLGGVLCAERTSEHTQLYREDEEAVFWSSPEECAAQSKRLLQDETFRNSVARSGRRRCLENRTTNQEVLVQILQKTFRSQSNLSEKQPQLSPHSDSRRSLHDQSARFFATDP
jgi:spore maturation protein CgeB